MMKHHEKQPMMKRSIRLIPFLFLISMMGFGQLTGIKTVPGDYADIASAISALNTLGVGPGGVTFNVTSGHTETFSSLTSGLITATGAAGDSVIFRKTGTGNNPKITAATPGSGNFDYIICIGGGDYITFDGIDVEDNLSNTTATERMEFGIALFKASGSDGAQHNTLKNGTISLLFNTNAYGITLDNRLYSDPGAIGLGVTAVSGTNSWNNICNMTLNNCYGGINLNGYADSSPFALYDQGNAIGVDGGNTFSYTGLAGTSVNSYGINAIRQNGMIIANNSFSGSMSMTTGRYYAMNLLDSDNADLDVFNNTLSMAFTGTGHFYGFYVNGMGRNGTSNIVNFYNNQVINNTFPNHTTGNVVYAYVTTGAVNSNCHNNLISNNTIGSPTANSTQLAYYLWFRSDPVNKAGTMNYHDNTISNNNRSSAAISVTSITYFLYNTGSTDTLNIYNNIIDNNTVVASNAYGIITAHIGKRKNIYNNTVSNISGRIGSFRGLQNGNGSEETHVYGNRFRNVSSDANPHSLFPFLYTITGIYQSSGNNNYYYNNYISELYAPFSAKTAVIGFHIIAPSNIYTGLYHNTIYLDGTSDKDGFGAMGIYAETGMPLDLRNNIVVLNTVPIGSGSNRAYSRNSGDLTTYQQVSDNNNFYAGTPGPNNLIYLAAGADSVQTLAEYQALVSPRDAHSVSEVPPFINVTTHPYNLHISPNTGTLCESGGTSISTPLRIDNDFDNDARFPDPGFPVNPLFSPTHPDIGADEFGGLRPSLVPANITLSNNTIPNGQDTCFNALQTITVAGGETMFTVENGGSAILIAGQNILFLPGVTVAEGGFLHGYITETNEFCSGDAPIVAVKSGLEDNAEISGKQAFRIYPNPTNGSFTIELTGNAAQADASLEIYGIRGNRVMTTSLSGSGKQVISLEGQPAGLYFIRLVSDGTSETGKLVKQ